MAALRFQTREETLDILGQRERERQRQRQRQRHRERDRQRQTDRQTDSGLPVKKVDVKEDVFPVVKVEVVRLNHDLSHRVG